MKYQIELWDCVSHMINNSDIFHLYVCMKPKVKKLIPYSANNLAADNNNDECSDKGNLHQPQLFNMFVPDLKSACCLIQR